jgi:hypothetical protein
MSASSVWSINLNFPELPKIIIKSDTRFNDTITSISIQEVKSGFELICMGQASPLKYSIINMHDQWGPNAWEVKKIAERDSYTLIVRDVVTKFKLSSLLKEQYFDLLLKRICFVAGVIFSFLTVLPVVCLARSFIALFGLTGIAAFSAILAFLVERLNSYSYRQDRCDLANKLITLVSFANDQKYNDWNIQEANITDAFPLIGKIPDA